MNASIKFCKAALDETANGEIILRGVIDPQSLQLLKTADYQREILPLAKINELIEAFEKGSVPDIDLGMRGQRFIERGNCFYLQDDVYIVDGLQRVSAGLHLLQRGTGVLPHLGAAIHFDTSEEWERERFRILNQDRTKLSANVLMRNLRHDYKAVDMLYRLSNNSNFVLKDRIAWNQRMTRQELINAMTYAKVVGELHAHMGPTLYGRSEDLSRGLTGVMKNIGENVMRDNVRTFFDSIDQMWGVKRVAYKEGAAYMRSNFLRTVARFYSKHLDFWREDRLVIEAPLQRKLASFPVTDPQVVTLASGNSTAGNLLLQLMVEHVNSGKRTRRLKPRVNDYVELDSIEDDED